MTTTTQTNTNFGEMPKEKQAEHDPLGWLKPKLVSELTTVQPEQILRGILYQRCKLALMGGSKSFKTWVQMDIAYCVANGLLFWGVHTKKCPVVYLDFELLDYDFRWRMEQIAAAYKAQGYAGKIDAVKRIGLKGKTIQDEHWTRIHEYILAELAGLTLCDPTYKLLGNRDENKAGDIAAVTAIFDRLTEATGSALLYSQHFSKGNQAGKESIDRGAGSGVWARDADAIVTMTKHKTDECLSVEATLRSFPKIDPFVVRWKCPLFERAPELNPADLKEPNRGRNSTYSIDDLMECLDDQNLSTSEFETSFIEAFGGSHATFNRILKAARQSGVLHKSKIDNKWEKVSK
jgi:RecA-family ATPase